MQTALRKMGNSTGLVVPKAMLTQLGLTSGARMDLSIEDGRIVASKADRVVREGWEEAAARIGALALTEQEKEWLDAPIDPVDDWTW